jgi:hypothetical protein
MYMAISVRNVGTGLTAAGRHFNVDRPDPR